MDDLRPKDKERLKSKDWRLSHFYKIKDKHKQLIVFRRNKAQQHFNTNKWWRNIVLKSRQLGFTTDETVDALDDVLFTPNFDALFIAHTLEDAKDIFDNKIDLAWENFPKILKEEYQPDTDTARKLKVGFGDGTSSSIAVSTSGRAGTFSRIHITEYAKLCKTFPDRAKEVREGSIPAVPTWGRVDIESTADGSDGDFYDMWWQAWERGDPEHPTQLKAHFYNWLWDEEIDVTRPIKDIPKEFREYQKLHKLSEQQISYYYLKFLSLSEHDRNWATMKKEYPTTPEEAFEGSGAKLFDGEMLSRQVSIIPEEIVGDVKYYREYQLGHIYGMGCDVAEGVGEDSSTMVIWDFTPAKPEIVATYDNNQIAPDLFAFEILNLAKRYEMPLIAVERNNHGHTTISKLREIYPVMYIYRDEKDKLGWETNVVSKPRMMYDLSTAINRGLVDLNSRDVISEARRYDKENLRIVRYNEKTTKHYDLLIGAVIGFQMKDFAAGIKRARKKSTSSGPRRGTGLRST